MARVSRLQYALIILSLVLFALATTSSAAQDLVDQDGDPLYNGASYYILPAVKGKGGGGGLELGKTGIEICPTELVQAPSQTSRGLPARLSSPLRIRTLRPSFRLAMEFKTPKSFPCNEQKISFGSFKIQPYKNHYKLRLCDSTSPDGANDAHDECRDLGISIDDQHNRRLVVNDGEPLIVQFAKAGGQSRG